MAEGKDKPTTFVQHSGSEYLDGMQRYQSLVGRLISALANKPVSNQKLESPGFDLFMGAAKAWMEDFTKNPQRLMELQSNYWRETSANYLNAQKDYFGSFGASWMPDLGVDSDAQLSDRRFKNPNWEKNPWLRFIRDQYLTTMRSTVELVGSLENIDQQERSRLEFFVQQILDMFSPTNFFASNPDAIEKAYETSGVSLLDGFENFVRDVEANKGRHAVALSDPDAFSLGENIGTTPGKVVFRNRLFELIQYSPQTEKVYAKPLVIIPPWINKFYILDLKPQNSFICYAVSEGFTVFVVSWVNPDETYADTGFDDYIKDGAATALETVSAITGEPKINAIGYCIGGTLLATTLAFMAAKKIDVVESATFFTTLLDFESPGEITAFFDEAMLQGLDEEISRQGYLDGYFMARAFSYLRARDLVYGPGVKSYLLGERPPAFDLLYWNGDSTNLPAKMAAQYLDRLYKRNEFMAGNFSVDGTPIKISEIKLPVAAIATRTDHIAPWKASFSGIAQMSGEKNLILADSGHIAGIVNPPNAKKYGYWTNAEPFELQNAEHWFDNSERHEGSWWPVWNKWLAKRSGKMVTARIPGSNKYPVLAEAPGEYVKRKA